MTTFSDTKGLAIKVSAYVKAVKMFHKLPKALVLTLYKGMNDNLTLDIEPRWYSRQAWNPSTKLVWVCWSAS